MKAYIELSAATAVIEYDFIPIVEEKQIFEMNPEEEVPMIARIVQITFLQETYSPQALVLGYWDSVQVSAKMQQILENEKPEVPTYAGNFFH